jgi:hypothetical protein
MILTRSSNREKWSIYSEKDPNVVLSSLNSLPSRGNVGGDIVTRVLLVLVIMNNYIIWIFFPNSFLKF